MSELTFETVMLIERDFVDKEDVEDGFFEMAIDSGYEYYLPNQSDTLKKSLNDATNVIITEGKKGETTIHYKAYASIPSLENTFIVLKYYCDERTKKLKRTTDGCQIKEGRAVYYSTWDLSRSSLLWLEKLDVQFQALLREETAFRLRFVTGELTFQD